MRKRSSGRWAEVVARWLSRWRKETVHTESSDEPRARFRTICVSREAGAGGGQLARMAGKRLGWKVYDHELIEAIARRMEVTLDEAKIYDELAPSVMQDWLLPLGEEHYAPHEAYLDHLAKLVQSIGRAGQSIIVGRGAAFLLPREEVLSLRVIAPVRERALRLGEQMGVAARTARRVARERDRRALKFARVMYRINAADPHHYDLVLDSNSLGLEIACEVIVRAIRAGEPPVPAPPAMGPPVLGPIRPEGGSSPSGLTSLT